MKFRERVVIFLATGLALGYIPVAPGTFGTVLGVAGSCVLAGIGVVPAGLAAAAFIFPAVWIAGRAEGLLGQKDDRRIVVDEVAGVMIALAGLPVDALNLAAGFLLFRALDVIKPFPARFIEVRMPGGWGVVLDDAVAGVYSNVCLRVMRAFLTAS